jgi:glycosyltransferase involved in cell wall biosynthesis
MQKFSIILPVKNGGNYIKDCVNSILSQTLQDFNLIVLDNYSLDGTLQWLKSLNDDRIIIYESEKPLSIEQNWSRIKDTPKNEFITLIGHDDILEPNYLEVMDTLIDKYPDASLYQAHYQYIDEKGNFIRNCLPMNEVQFAHEFLADFMCRTIDSTGTGYVMRSKDYDSLGGINPTFPNLIFADYALWLNLSLLKYKVTSSATAFKYRIHDSVSKITNGEKYSEAFLKFLDLINSLCSNPQINAVTKNYGREMLMYYCESLSHRILKTPRTQRKITVNDFINDCIKYSQILIPGQDFQPSRKFRIKIAQILDSTFLTQTLFLLMKKMV